MKALTLTQPWATLVAIGAKSIETRSWSTSYRGPVAIHAAKKFPAEARMLCPVAPFSDALGMETLHTGQIVAVADLSTVFRFDHRTWFQVEMRAQSGRLPRHEVDFGDYTEGRYGFVLTGVRRLHEPVAARGMLSLWDVPHEAETAVVAQLAGATTP